MGGWFSKEENIVMAQENKMDMGNIHFSMIATMLILKVSAP